jgi:hypothetical protein
MPPGNSYEDEWFLHNTRWMILAGFFWFLLRGSVFRNFPFFLEISGYIQTSGYFLKISGYFRKKIPAPPKNLLPHFSKRLSPRPIKKNENKPKCVSVMCP